MAGRAGYRCLRALGAGLLAAGVAALVPLQGTGAVTRTGVLTASGALASPAPTWHQVGDPLPPATTQLADLACASSADCVAVGQTWSGAPSLLTTTNGGASWQVRRAPAGTQSLTFVSCGSTSSCVAVGNDRLPPSVILTADGGASWSAGGIAPFVAAGGYPTALSCAGPTGCMLVGAGQSTGATNPPEAARTADGGRSWTDVASPPSLTHLASVTCPTATTCLVAGTGPTLASDTGAIAAVTTNDGGSWTAVDLPASIGEPIALRCGSASHCVLLANFLPGSCCTATIATTDDGGHHWTAVTPPAALSTPEGLSCPTAADCYASFETYAGGVEALAIAVSTSGGTGWAVREAYPGDDSLGSVSCGSPTACVAIHETYFGAGMPSGPQGQPVKAEGFVRTADGGASWPGSSVPAGVVSFTGASCTPAGTCVAVGWRGGGPTSVILSSQDGGTSWRSRSVPAGARWLESASCAGSTCVAVGDAAGDFTKAAAATSNDGGRTWSVAALPPGTPDLVTVSCATASTCWAAGGGTVVTTTDAGATWHPPAGEPAAVGLTQASGIACTSVTTCTVVGQTKDGIAAAFHTADGGASWPGTALGAALVTGIGCSASGYCFAPGVVGDPTLPYESWGDVETSRDAGAHWSTDEQAGDLPSGAESAAVVTCPAPLGCLLVASASPGFAGGGAVTGDGGYHWAPLGVEAGDTGAACASTASCVVVGADGAISSSSSVFAGPPFPVAHGYRLVASDGGVFSFGAPFYGSEGGRHLNRPIVGLALDPATGGYWLVASDGGIFAFHASFFGSEGGRHLNAPIVAMASTPDGGGYWLLGRDGGVFTFGDARYRGSDTGQIGRASAVGIAPSNAPDNGYLILTSNGFQEFNGPTCPSGSPPPHPAGIATSLPLGPYPGLDPQCLWSSTAYAVSSGGAVAALDGATPRGGVSHPPSPVVVGIAVNPANPYYPPSQGYWLADARGDVFAFGAPYFGSMAHVPLTAPVAGIAPG